MLSVDNRWQIRRGHRQIPQPLVADLAVDRGHQTGDFRSGAAAPDLQRVHLRLANGNVAQKLAQDDHRRTKAPMRNGRLFHSLQSATGPPDTHLENLPEHVFQAEKLQNRRLVRQKTARTWSET